MKDIVTFLFFFFLPDEEVGLDPGETVNPWEVCTSLGELLPPCVFLG